jgi:hypothetical protein
LDLFDRPPEGIVGYTAGLIDGEGSIYFVAGNNRFGCNVAQSAGNDGEELVRWLREQWGIGTINCQRKASVDGNPPRNRSDCWIWAVNGGRELEWLLATCLPYLRVKRNKAERAVDLVRRRLDAGVRFAWTPGEDRYLSEHWREPDEDLAAAIRRPERSVRHRRRFLGLPRKPLGGYADKWSSDQDEYLRANLGCTNSALGGAIGKSQDAVRGRLRRLGLRRG